MTMTNLHLDDILENFSKHYFYSDSGKLFSKLYRELAMENTQITDIAGGDSFSVMSCCANPIEGIKLLDSFRMIFPIFIGYLWKIKTEREDAFITKPEIIKEFKHVDSMDMFIDIAKKFQFIEEGIYETEDGYIRQYRLSPLVDTKVNLVCVRLAWCVYNFIDKFLNYTTLDSDDKLFCRIPSFNELWISSISEEIELEISKFGHPDKEKRKVRLESIKSLEEYHHD